MFDRSQLSLYLVTDRQIAGGRDIIDIVLQAVRGGATMVQLREKELDTRSFTELARALKSRLTGVPLIINDRIDVALASGADGVHIGQSDMPYAAARSLLGPSKIIGLSVETMDQVRQANALDVDYIGISPVFPTPTKTDTAPAFGLEGLRQACSISVHPAVGIGGMNLATAAEVMRAGADGIAVVSAIIGAQDPCVAAAALRNAVSKVHRNLPPAPASLRTPPRVLTIAGSDSGGGAGIQADIKTISATGSYAASAITAVTVQNTLGVSAVHTVPDEIVSGQISAVLEDIGANAVKIGMLSTASVIRTVRSALERFELRNIVLDPVMVATSGDRLIEESAVKVLAEELAPYARVLTPNIPEAEILSGVRIGSQTQLPSVGRLLSEKMYEKSGRKVSVLMKAGHLDNAELIDYLYDAESDELFELRSERIDSPNTHGTGCTLSSALASYLAQGLSLPDAARAAKAYITGAIRSGASLRIGSGHGPVDHGWRQR